MAIDSAARRRSCSGLNWPIPSGTIGADARRIVAGYYTRVVVVAPSTPTTPTPTQIGGPQTSHRIVRGRHRHEEELLERHFRDRAPKPPAKVREPAAELLPLPPSQGEIDAAIAAIAPPRLAPFLATPAPRFDEAAWGLAAEALRREQEADDEEALLLILAAL